MELWQVVIASVPHLPQLAGNLAARRSTPTLSYLQKWAAHWRTNPLPLICWRISFSCMHATPQEDSFQAVQASLQICTSEQSQQLYSVSLLPNLILLWVQPYTVKLFWQLSSFLNWLLLAMYNYTSNYVLTTLDSALTDAHGSCLVLRPTARRL